VSAKYALALRIFTGEGIMELSKELLLNSARYLRKLAEAAHPPEGGEYFAKAEMAENLADQYPSKPVPILSDFELECQGWTCNRDWEAYPPTLKEVHKWWQSRKRLAESRRMISFTGAFFNRMHRMRKAEECYEALGLL
jgi:hypothetical protein